ncbi:STAS domain-containing protein [Ottowia sp. VDI28]|uniref:STAS domain-containing protein n=1 Tax=Ottowia sp. VDI28 TaxID=3133968 RepID=UPI003C2D4906
MSKESGSSGKRGLLSKVVKFVSSPTTHWSDLDRPENHQEASDSRLALKEMIERKRRNDFVRNREFDLLRKARRREVSGIPGPGNLSSFPSSSQFSDAGERARTLEKIDEIEKQMSSVWLRRKGESNRVPLSPAAGSPTGPASLPSAGVHSTSAGQDFLPTVHVDDLPLPEQQPSDAEPEPTAEEAAAPSVLPSAIPLAPPALNGGVAGMESFAEARQEPEIEEAAIRFANGDVAGAETGLLEVLRETDPRSQQQDIWLTLFDFYRAAGDQQKFDDAAIEFAGRFGRSAPQWALGPVLNSQTAALVTEPAPLSSNAQVQWVAPSSMGVQSVAALNATLARNAPPWRIDWRYLKTIEPAALPVFAQALQQWADTPVHIHFLGGERLMQLLVDGSPTDDRSVDPMWWTARLGLLRVQGEMDEFELVALKYCVTYEVSPPAWQEPGNSFSVMTSDGASSTVSQSLNGGLARNSSAIGLTPLGDGSVGSHGVFKVDLQGELLGDAEAALNSLSLASDTASIEFHCNQLTRVDFGAAGTLLNWAAAQQGAGRQIVFKHVNRLVAAFFGVVGITEIAHVRLRKD